MLAGKLLNQPVALRAEQTGEISGSFVWQDRGEKPGARSTLARLALRLRDNALRRADHFVAISAAIADEFKAAGFPAARVCRIPNGVDLAVFQPATRDRARELRECLRLPDTPFSSSISFDDLDARGKDA